MIGILQDSRMTCHTWCLAVQRVTCLEVNILQRGVLSLVVSSVIGVLR